VKHLIARSMRETERERYAKRSCVDLQSGIMERTPWCKKYTVIARLPEYRLAPSAPGATIEEHSRDKLK
jgi:hypothetical protein